MTDDVRAFPALPGSLPKIDTGLANVARAWNYMDCVQPGGSWSWRVKEAAAPLFPMRLLLMQLHSHGALAFAPAA